MDVREIVLIALVELRWRLIKKALCRAMAALANRMGSTRATRLTYFADAALHAQDGSPPSHDPSFMS